MILPFELDRPLAFLDLETTGLSTVQDRIVELAIIRISPQGDVLERYADSIQASRFLRKPQRSTESPTRTWLMSHPFRRPPGAWPSSWSPATWEASTFAASTSPFFWPNSREPASPSPSRDAASGCPGDLPPGGTSGPLSRCPLLPEPGTRGSPHGPGRYPDYGRCPFGSDPEVPRSAARSSTAFMPTAMR